VRGPHHMLDQMAKRYQCAKCCDRSRLAVRWYQGEYDLYCGVCGNRTDFREVQTLTQAWRQDPDSIPYFIAAIFERKYGGRRMSDQELVKGPEQQMLTRIESRGWATGMTLPDKLALADLARRYRLDPFMGELIWYEGSPYITFQGNLRNANRTPGWEGIELRPMTPEEVQGYGIHAPYVWICKVWKKGMRVPAVGIGTADPEKPHRSRLDESGKKWIKGNPIERDKPWAMARVRAGNAALRLYFPHGLPMRTADDEGILVDPETGEIIEGEYSVVQSEAKGAAPTEEPEPPPEPTAEATGEGDQTVEDLWGSLTREPDRPDAAEEPDRKAEARRQIHDLLTEMGGTENADFERYFHNTEGVDWAKASYARLNHFAHHLADVKADRAEKARGGTQSNGREATDHAAA